MQDLFYRSTSNVSLILFINYVLCLNVYKLHLLINSSYASLPFTLRWIILHACWRRGATFPQDLTIERTSPRRITSIYCVRKAQNASRGRGSARYVRQKYTGRHLYIFLLCTLLRRLPSIAWNFFAGHRDECASRYATRRQEYTSSRRVYNL